MDTSINFDSSRVDFLLGKTVPKVPYRGITAAEWRELVQAKLDLVKPRVKHLGGFKGLWDWVNDQGDVTRFTYEGPCYYERPLHPTKTRVASVLNIGPHTLKSDVTDVILGYGGDFPIRTETSVERVILLTDKAQLLQWSRTWRYKMHLPEGAVSSEVVIDERVKPIWDLGYLIQPGLERWPMGQRLIGGIADLISETIDDREAHLESLRELQAAVNIHVERIDWN